MGYSNDDTHIFIILRDKDNDITWLYGPWKRSVNFDPSASQMWPVQTNYTRLSTSPQYPHQNELDVYAHQRILPTPDFVPPHMFSKRKVRLKSTRPRNSRQLAHHQSEIDRIASHGKAINPSPFQPRSTAISLSPTRYPLGVHFLPPDVQSGRSLDGRTIYLLIFVIQSPGTRTFCVTFATCTSETYRRKTTALVVRDILLLRAQEVSHSHDRDNYIFSFCEREKHLGYLLLKYM